MTTKKILKNAGIVLLLAVLTFGAVREYRSQQETARRLTGTAEVTKADITAKASGYLKALYIKEGDSVTTGMTAALLDRQDLSAALLRDESARQKAQAQLTALENGARPEERRTAAASTAAAQAAADKANRSREPGRRAILAGHFDCRRQQRPETGCDHHPGCEAKHSIQDFSLDVFEEKYHARTQGCQAPRKNCG